MKASVLAGPSQSKVMDIPTPEIGSEEVLVRVQLCGVCASELPAWVNGQGGGQRVFGHEAVGVVASVGENVVGFAPGDRVTGLIFQAFAEYAKADYRNLAKVPAGLADMEALGEPLSCLVSGANRIDVALGDRVAVIGPGFMGLGFMQLMKLKGAGQITAVAIRDASLRHAARFGANVTLHPDEVTDDDKVVNWADISLNRGIPIVAECSGTQSGLDLASEMTSAHGIMSIVGFHQGNNGNRNVNMEQWNFKAITVVNAHERRRPLQMEAMKNGLSLIEQGLFNMKDMITHKYALDEVDHAFTAMMDKPEDFIKAVITIS
ncbi:zinc-binding dehydrogenase [Alicyclobacillus fodiniaquatilis]|jgi:threonine dehydrogenase-like Zn-dependent dehydrogenase|uniref:Zinc-binding dehydrogenase n=1 Tax=Alicyclobacillus fodiniaquatilis TaxID=1661150 RepID=A0ABW4JE35_9BACL